MKTEVAEARAKVLATMGEPPPIQTPDDCIKRSKVLQDTEVYYTSTEAKNIFNIAIIRLNSIRLEMLNKQVDADWAAALETYKYNVGLDPQDTWIFEKVFERKKNEIDERRKSIEQQRNQLLQDQIKALSTGQL